jgi:hypothetical protein
MRPWLVGSQAVGFRTAKPWLLSSQAVLLVILFPLFYRSAALSTVSLGYVARRESGPIEGDHHFEELCRDSRSDRARAGLEHD